MEFGSVADWVKIGIGALVFSGAQIATWTLLKRDVKANTAAIGRIGAESKGNRAEIETIKESRAAESEAMQSYVDAVKENSNEIKAMKNEVITVTNHKIMQGECQANLIAMIKENKRDTEGIRASIKEVKEIVQSQGEHFQNIFVAIAQLGTKLDERTEKRTS